MSKDYELAFKLNAKLESQFGRSFSDAGRQVESLERKFNNLGRFGAGWGNGIIKSLTSIGKAAGLAAGVGVAGGVYAAGSFISNSFHKAMDFESEMSTIQALTGASTAEMSKMQVLALKLGADTKYSALEAAQGIEELLKAGLEPAQVQAGGLEAALNLATAGGLDLAEAATTMSTAMNGFKKDGMSAAKVADILAGTANASATGVHDLSYAIASGGAVADMAGLSFKDFNTAIGLMSNDGLVRGSDAGTSFKAMLMYLQPQTKQATKLFNELGIGVGKANKFFNKGKIKDIAGIADVLKKAFGGMSEQTQTKKMMEMFGTDGVKAAASLFDAGADGVKKFQEQMTNVTALEVARKKMDNAAGSVEQFRGALETLQISGLMPVMPLIKKAANAAADFVTDYTPQITAGIQSMVDTATKYWEDHFTNNPEFKKLTTFNSQVGFVFGDIEKSFNEWWASTGQEKVRSGMEQGSKLAIGTLEASVPELSRIGLKFGSTLASGIADGLRQSKSLGWLFKIQDTLTPSFVKDIWQGKGASATTKDMLIPDWIYNDNGGGWGALGDSLKKFWDLGIVPGSSKPKKNALGSIVTSPTLTWVGEGGDNEAIIPINRTQRARNLWAQTGQMLGANPFGQDGGTTINYSPTFNISGSNGNVVSGVQEAARMAQSEFERMSERMITQRRRVSFQQ